MGGNDSRKTYIYFLIFWLGWGHHELERVQGSGERRGYFLNVTVFFWKHIWVGSRTKQGFSFIFSMRHSLAANNGVVV